MRQLLLLLVEQGYELLTGFVGAGLGDPVQGGGGVCCWVPAAWGFGRVVVAACVVGEGGKQRLLHFSNSKIYNHKQCSGTRLEG